MKSQLALMLTLTLLPSSRAEDARFFRVAGPVASTITAFSADGNITWTNTPTNATFTVQTASSLVGPSNWVDYLQMPATNAATTNRLFDPNPPAGMALIPAGSFTMGDNLDGDSFALPLHTVYVSALYMDKYDVTLSLWQPVYIWAVAHGYSFDYAGSVKAANHPVQTVDWYDCVKWCNARSEKEGLNPCYYTDAGQTVVYRNGQLNLTNACVNWGGTGYRLPTEAEWEKSARGGASGQRFPWGNTITESQANYYSCLCYTYDLSNTGYNLPFSGGHPFTSPVDYFAPNGYGLYDMAGNVWQWCWDWFDYYSSGSQTDPRGPSGVVSGRVLRGGNWGSDAYGARYAFHGGSSPDIGSYDLGFRCVRGL